MPAVIKNFDPGSEYYFKEGCHIIEVSNSYDDPDLSIVRARVEPGETTQWHLLVDTTERYVILSGHGEVELGEREPRQVSAGDVVIIPAGVRQRIHNRGAQDLLFLAICSPRFAEHNYRSL